MSKLLPLATLALSVALPLSLVGCGVDSSGTTGGAGGKASSGSGEGGDRGGDGGSSAADGGNHGTSTSGTSSAETSGATSSTSTATSSVTGSGASTTGAATTGGGGGDEATLELSFGGACAPDFDGDLVVAANAESVAITRVDGVFVSIQFDLHSTLGAIALSTAERVANGDVVNLIVDTTWTNISTETPDPVAGSILVNDYQEQAGIVDLELVGVVLQNPSTGTLCTIDGTIVTTGTSF